MSTLGSGSRLSFSQIENLWIQNGGNPLAAPIMAAIAIAESGGLTNNLNNNPGTRDYSVGLWQINYYGALAPGRTKSYGAPAQLASDPNAQAKAAISLSGNGNNLTPWTTYTSGTATKILNQQGGALGAIPALPPLATAAPGPAGAGSVDNEGFLFNLGGTKVLDQTVVPGLSMQRSTARKIVGGAVLVAGGIVGLVGIFVLVGAKSKLPGAAGLVQGAVGAPGRLAQQRRAGRHEEARVTMRARRAQQERQDEELFQRSRTTKKSPDELAERRRARERARMGERSRDATEAGRRAADAAGPF